MTQKKTIKRDNKASKLKGVGIQTSANSLPVGRQVDHLASNSESRSDVRVQAVSSGSPLEGSVGPTVHGIEVRRDPALLMAARAVANEFTVISRAFSSEVSAGLSPKSSRSSSLSSFSIAAGEHTQVPLDHYAPADTLDDEIANSNEAAAGLSLKSSRSSLVSSFSIAAGEHTQVPLDHYAPADTLDNEIANHTKQIDIFDAFDDDWDLVAPEHCRTVRSEVTTTGEERPKLSTPNQEPTRVKGNYSTPPSIVFDAAADIWVNASRTVASRTVRGEVNTTGEERPKLPIPNQEPNGVKGKYSPPPSIVFDGDDDIGAVADEVTTTADEVTTTGEERPELHIPNQVQNNASSFAARLTARRAAQNDEFIAPPSIVM